MAAEMASENREVRKQIGCMNALFQLFGRRHFLAGRSFSSHNQNRLLLVGAQQQVELRNATNIVEKDPEVQKEKRRASSESSHAITSSSSLDYNRQIHISENRFQIKEQRHPLSKSQQSPDIRDVVKDSIYREARGVPITSLANDEKEAMVKHIDSPRPSQQSKFRKPKATVNEGTKCLKDERLALARFSYDGRESQDVFKTNMKLKELPRFSLDSKASSIKCSALESKSKILDRESGNHSRSNSIVAKLMGMDSFPESITTDESLIAKINSTESLGLSPRVASLSSTAEGRKQKQVSPRSHNASSIRNTTMCSRLPIERAPWKQQSYTQGSPKMAKAAKNSPHTPSVYGEIEKRIAQLEFKRSGKDLRALKQILEAMQNTRGRLENQGGESTELKVQERSSLEDSSFDRNNNFSKIQRYKGSSSNQLIIKETMHHRDDQAHKEKAKYCTLRNNNMKEAHQLLPSIGKKITRRNLVLEQILKAPQRIRVEKCTASERDCRMASPRVHHIVLKTEGESHPKGTIKKQSSKKAKDKCPNRKHRVKSTDMHLNEDQLSNFSSETRYSSCLGDTASTKSESNNSMVSHIETDNFMSSNSRKQQDYVPTSKAAVEFAVIMAEQPSPVSVLETSFYSEGSPSPVKKISSAFRDEGPNPDELEWHLENLNHLTTDNRKSDSDYKYNQNSKNLHLCHEPILSKTEDDGAAADHSEPNYRSINLAHRYITKILLASPLLNHINPEMLHALAEEDDQMEEAVRELIEKNDQKKLSQKIQRKIVTDMINEILDRKMISGGLFTVGRKSMTLQGLTKEVYLDMGHLCRMPYCNTDDEEDRLIRMLTTDMKYQSDDWTDYCVEVPVVVLDIERLIFKDLINEIVTCEVVCSSSRPKRHHRQHFTKKSFNLIL